MGHTMLVSLAAKVLVLAGMGAHPAPAYTVITMPAVTIICHAPAKQWVCGDWRALDAVQSVRSCEWR